MKPIHAITALVALLVVMSTVIAEGAGVPPLLNVQGRLSDLSDIPVSDGPHSLIFVVYSDSIGLLPPLWAETLNVQVSGGLFSTVLGRTKSLPTTLFDGGPNRFMGVRVDGAAELPRVRFNSVGYALRSQNADTADLALNITCVNCVGAGEIAPDAVGSAEIATNAVGSDEIAANAVGGSEISTGAVGADEINTGAVRSDEVQDGTLTAVDLMDEPGLTSDAGGSIEFTPASGLLLLMSHVVDPPAPGYLLAIAQTNVQWSHEVGDTSAALLGVSSSPTSLTSDQDVYVGISEDVPDGFYSHVATVHQVFTTDGSPVSLYFLAQSLGARVMMRDNRLSVLYFATAYGIIDPINAAADEPDRSPEKSDWHGRPSKTSREPDITLIQQLEVRIKALEEQAAKKSDGEN